MSFELNIDVDTDQLTRQLNDVARKQVPFAMAKTLTLLAKEASDTKRGQLQGIFKLRNKRVEKGFTIVPARKADWPLQEAQVVSKDDFMVLHEIGGKKRPEKGAKRIAIPTKAVKRTASGAVRKAMKPKSILSKRTGSLTSSRSGPVIRRKTTKRSPLGIFWLLRPSAQIKPVLGLQKTTERIVKKSHSKVFGKELGRAIGSAR